MTSTQRVKNILLLDIETTGFCQDQDSQILEVAMAPVFPKDWHGDKQGYSAVGDFAISADNIFCEKVFVSEDDIKKFSPWIRNTHGRAVPDSGNGLAYECWQDGLRPQQLEQRAMKWLMLNGFVPGEIIPAGNSVWTDRVHMMRHLPALERMFFHRNFDFSSFKVAAATFGIPEDEDPEKKGDNHRARPGLFAALGRLNFYWEAMIEPALASFQGAARDEEQ